MGASPAKITHKAIKTADKEFADKEFADEEFAGTST